jgi:hypothetical protein
MASVSASALLRLNPRSQLASPGSLPARAYASFDHHQTWEVQAGGAEDKNRTTSNCCWYQGGAIATSPDVQTCDTQKI